MNDKEFIQTGVIVNTHGIRGEVKIDPWADSPEFVTKFDFLYVDGAPYRVLRARVHKNMLIAQLEGVNDMTAAELLKTKAVYIRRADAKLPEGAYFVNDLIGMTAVDADTGAELGKVRDIITLPAGCVAEIKGKREILVPVRPEFIISREGDTVKIHLIEGM